MAITVQAGTGVAYGSTIANTVPLPADVAAGDLLILLVSLQNDATSCTSPGWVEILNELSGVPGDNFRVLTKTAGAGETTPTVTLGATNNWVAMIVRVRDPGGAPAQLTTNNSATDTASIDPPTAGSVKIGVVHVDPGAAGAVTWAGGATGLGGIALGTSAYLSAAYKLEDTAGALTFTHTITGNTGTLVMSVAPLAAGTTVGSFSRLKLGDGLTGTDLGGGVIEVDAAAGGGVPSGPAGGVLAGTYPNPTFASDMATQAELDATAALAIPKGVVDAGGDLIVGTGPDAVARLAKGTDGQMLQVAAGAVGWAAPTPPAYGTTPPASPTDGQEWVLPVDTATGVMWRFRYNASSASAYKWEFVGGAPRTSGPAGSRTYAGTILDTLTGGPSVTFPRAGDYFIDFGLTAKSQAATATILYVATWDGVNPSANSLEFLVSTHPSGAGISSHERRAGLLPGAALTLLVASTAGVNGLFEKGWIRVWPRRVS